MGSGAGHRHLEGATEGYFKGTEDWYARQAPPPPATGEPPEVHDVSAIEGSKAWARLLARIYDIDVFRCLVCGNRMSVIPVIRDPAEIRPIIACLVKHGRDPPDEG